MSTKTSKALKTRKFGTGVPQDECNYEQIHVVTTVFPSAAGKRGKVKVETGLLW